MGGTDLTKDLTIADLRISIDNIDASFLRLLAERMRVVRKIIQIKKTAQVDLGQSQERRQDITELVEMSVQLELKKAFFERILDLIFLDAIGSYGQESDEQKDDMDEICTDLKLDDLRMNLKNLDKSLCIMLAERFRIVKRMGIYKHKIGVPPLDPTRWQLVLEDKINSAQSLNLSASLVKDIYNAIHQLSLDIEGEIASANRQSDH
jgi:chorismate mutase